MVRHAVRQEIYGVLAFVGCVWLVFVICWLVPFPLASYGIVPRRLVGLVGIVTAPFLHDDLKHIASNTGALTALLMVLAGTRGRSLRVVSSIVLLSGMLIWLFGRHANHIGASSLIYGLITYLIVSGVLERKVLPMIVSLIVGIVYGGTLALDILPRWASTISWEGHLFGAVAGVVVAWWMSRDRRAESNTVALD